MKRLIWLLTLGFILSIKGFSQLSTDRNFVSKTDIKKPGVLNQAQADALGVADKQQQVNYFDGLGRSIQTVSTQANPQQKDIITPVEYDNYGREIKKYLPYADLAGSTFGSMRNSAYSDQVAFYDPATSSNIVAKDVNPYAQVFMEFSPINRPLENGAPGAAWQPGNDHVIKQQQLINTVSDEVRVWKINIVSGISDNMPVPENDDIYGDGELFKTVSIDEAENKTIEYKDREGHVLLKKVQLTASPGQAHTGWLCTYYVYDDFGLLRFVIPPKAVEWLADINNNWSFESSEGNSVVDELCFRYEYDERGRMTAKKAPGVGWEYMVYDNRDRLVFTQDANMRIKRQWLTTLYDYLNRPILTGMIVYPVEGTSPGTAADYAALQDDVKNNPGTGPSTVIAHRPANNNYPGSITLNSFQNGKKEYKATDEILLDDGFETGSDAGFTAVIVERPTASGSETVEVYNSSIPAGCSLIALTHTYYDDYSFTDKIYSEEYNSKLNAGTNGNQVTPPLNADQLKVQIKGLVTGTSVRTLPDPNDLTQGFWLTTVTFYDDKGRVLQTHSDNYKGGEDIATNLYDFSGKLLCNHLVHTNPVNPEVDLQQMQITTRTEYDHAGRVMHVYKKINDACEKSIDENSYDELGQLNKKSLGDNTAGNIEVKKELEYEYNIRGWLTGINKGYANGQDETHWFGMELNYNTGATSNQFNGNISRSEWRSQGDGAQREYQFGYDRVNRLMSADFKQKFGESWGINDPGNASFNIDFSVKMGNGTDPETAYDANGNIIRMRQWGLQLNTSTPPIDDLNYTYATGSINGNRQTNKLLNVIDRANNELTKLGDFRTSANHPEKLIKANAFTDPYTITDYAYDPNGNLTKDFNKDIDGGAVNGILYNHLNLPWKITIRNKGTITYIYDAAGNKLEKIVDEPASAANNNKAKTISTAYLGSFNYENNLLQFFGQEEGRIRVKDKTEEDNCTGTIPKEFVFDYFIKDHLGNVRMVLTDENQKDIYPAATLETESADWENKYYNIQGGQGQVVPTPTSLLNGAQQDQNYQNVNTIPNNNPLTPGSGIKSQQMYKLNGTGGGKTGLGITLKVMSGDKIDIYGRSYYEDVNNGDNSQNNLVPLNILTGLLNMAGMAGVLGSHVGVQASTLDNISGINSAVGGFLTNYNRQPVSGNRPRAYINYILFDEQFNYVSGGVSAVDPDPLKVKEHSDDLQNIPVIKNGFIYVYCSNESPVNVFFDNLQVKHVRSALIEETHYYPFGLTMSGISSKAASITLNKMKYNDKEQQSQEFSDGSGLEFYDYGARMQDPQIGRWHVVDPMADKFYNETPYNYVGNNPANLVDEGGQFKMKPKDKEKYTVLANYLKNGISEILQSKNIMRALMKYGKFTEKDIRNKIVNSGEGSIGIDIVPNAKIQFGGNGYYPDGKGNNIQINEELVKQLQSASPEDRQAALLAVISTILHEATHRGDWDFDNKRNDEVFFGLTKEVGEAFETDAYFDGDFWKFYNSPANKRTPASIDAMKEIINRKKASEKIKKIYQI